MKRVELPVDALLDGMRDPASSGASPAVAARVREAFATVAARWPGLVVTSRAASGLGARLAGDDAQGALAWPDLLLASACLAGDRGALRVLEEELIAAVPAFVSRMKLSRADVDEVVQRTREKLLLPSGDAGSPGLLKYRGRGPLGGFVRVMAVNTALNLRRGSASRGDQSSRDPTKLVSAATPESMVRRAELVSCFREAVGSSLAAEPPNVRGLFRLHFLEGLSIDAIAAIDGAHRATVARRIVRARASVLARTEALLRERLGDDARLASVVAELGSKLEITVERLLTG